LTWLESFDADFSVLTGEGGVGEGVFDFRGGREKVAGAPYFERYEFSNSTLASG
jgi:hypothetical protein